MDDGLYGLIDFVEPTVENPNKVAKDELYLSKGDDKTRNALKKVLDFVYPFEKSSRISPKYTVTEINRLVRDEENEGFTPSMINPSSDNRRAGIAYHTVMENIDFSTSTVSEINYLLKNLVENGVLQDGDEELVDANDILRCIQSPVIQEGIKGRYIRENRSCFRCKRGKSAATRPTIFWCRARSTLRFRRRKRHNRLQIFGTFRRKTCRKVRATTQNV